MLNLQVIGNLGSDAVVKENNGKKFVTFKNRGLYICISDVENQCHFTATSPSLNVANFV